MNSERILVTGGTGFIGGKLVRRLLADGHRVRVLCLPSDPGMAGIGELGAEAIVGDLTDPTSVHDCMAGIDRVYHCAGVVTDWAPRALFDSVNVDGMANMLQAAVRHRIKRFVWISTNDVFGLAETRIITEDDDLRPWAEPYPDTKIRAERLAWAAYRRWRLPVATVYPCWVYGPGDTTFMPLLAEAIIERQMIFWRRDALVWPAHIDNVVDLLIRIGWSNAAVGQGYLVHDGVCVTPQELCRRIAKGIGAPEPRLHIPYGVACGLAVAMEVIWRLLGLRSRPLLTTYAVKNLGSRLRFSIDKARRELGWTPPVAFEDGFAETMRRPRTLDEFAPKQGPA